MRRNTLFSLHLLFAASVLFLVTACRPPLPSTEDDLADYLLYGTQGGKVRRLDHKAQTYADNVLSLFYQLKKARQPALSLHSPTQLWPIENKDKTKPSLWTTEQAKKRLALVNKWLADAPTQSKDPKQKPPPTRSMLRAHLQTLVNSPPALPAGMPPRAPLVKRLTQAILHPNDGEETRAKNIAQHYATLLPLVIANKDYIKSPQGRAAWQKINDYLTQSQTQQLHKMRFLLDAQKTHRDQILKRKKDIRSAGLSNETSWRSYLRLELEVHYYDALIQKAEAALKFAPKSAPILKAAPARPQPTTRPQPTARPQPTSAPTSR